MLASWYNKQDLCYFKFGVYSDDIQEICHMIDIHMYNHYVSEHSLNPPMYPFDSLLLTLYWLRHYPSERALAAELNSAPKSIWELIHHTLTILYQVIVHEYINKWAKPTEYGEIELSRTRYYLIVDSTHIALYEPFEREERKHYYHHQSGTGYGLKCQIAVDRKGVIYRVTNVVEGSKHDLTLLRESGLLGDCSSHYRIIEC
jgi:hypothetical protein